MGFRYPSSHPQLRSDPPRVGKFHFSLSRAVQIQLSGSDRLPMIDLLLQLAYVALVLAVISLFICTLPVWVDRAGGRAFICGDCLPQQETGEVGNQKSWRRLADLYITQKTHALASYRSTEDAGRGSMRTQYLDFWRVMRLQGIRYEEGPVFS